MQTQMQTQPSPSTEDRYARCLENSRRIRWDIDRDVIRGRTFDFSSHFLPDGLSMVNRLPFLNAADARLLSQIQGRTYANIFGLVERWINAKVLELSPTTLRLDSTSRIQERSRSLRSHERKSASTPKNANRPCPC